MSDQLVIRTMKDDIAQMNAIQNSASAPVSKPKRERAQAPVFSLPTATTPLSIELVTTSTKKIRTILFSLGYIALFCALVAGGVYGYMQWDTKQVTQNIAEKDPLFSQLIPKEVLAVVDYNIETEENRNIVRQMWSETQIKSDAPFSISDPTTLLNVSDISHLYYLIMPGNQTPFLLFKETEGTKEYVSQHSELQVVERNGWYILHATNVNQYTTALENGSIGEESPLLAAANNPMYVIRYAMSAAFVSEQFNTKVASAIGFSQSNGLVFHVTEPTNDGTLRASALITGDPPGEGVVDATSELISLIPSDITFGHVGLNFAQELNLLPEDSSQFDSTILTQPAVRQFTSLFTTPYAIFERKGADGIQDIGFIIALPDSLKKKTVTGEPILEQALPALIPLIIGTTLGIQVAFNDGLYNGVPLRYVNIIGQTQTLDYTVGDNYLLVASSREGINALINTSVASKQGISTEEPLKSLGEKAAAILKNKSFIVGALNNSAMKSVLPIATNLNQVPIIASLGKTSTGIAIQIVLLSR